jgi:hypothetical protein
LKPAHVVVVSKDKVFVDKEVVALMTQVKAQEDWTIPNLQQRLQDAFTEADAKRKANGLGAVRDAVQAGQPVAPGGTPAKDPAEQAAEDDRRITVQADKSIDFLTIKKVMYTVTNAGASQINFAVMKNTQNPQTVQ